MCSIDLLSTSGEFVPSKKGKEKLFSTLASCKLDDGSKCDLGGENSHTGNKIGVSPEGDNFNKICVSPITDNNVNP
jgi:hypothetical protein